MAYIGTNDFNNYIYYIRSSWLLKSIIDTFESVKNLSGKISIDHLALYAKDYYYFFFLMKANKDLFTSQLKREQ